MRESNSSCASAFSSLGILVLAACGGASAVHPSRPTDAAVEPSASARAIATPSPSAKASVADAGVDPYAVAAPTSAKSIGHTSYVLKVRLEGGSVAAYKPRSTLPLGDRRYRGEIAAFRLATALGISNVPRAIPRSFPASELAAAFSTPEGRQDFERKARVDRDGRVRGAILPWIEGYEELPLEQPAWRTKWTAWLTRDDAVFADADRITAAAISTMLGFDYLTANWDRWSGGNVARDAAGTILFVDNDGAFYEAPPAADLARQRARLGGVVRFSRAFVTALRSLDDASLRAAFGDESPGNPLLPDRVIAGVEARRSALLELIDAQIARAGEASSLAFP